MYLESLLRYPSAPSTERCEKGKSFGKFIEHIVDARWQLWCMVKAQMDSMADGRFRHYTAHTFYEHLLDGFYDLTEPSKAYSTESQRTMIKECQKFANIGIHVLRSICTNPALISPKDLASLDPIIAQYWFDPTLDPCHIDTNTFVRERDIGSATGLILQRLVTFISLGNEALQCNVLNDVFMGNNDEGFLYSNVGYI